MRTGRLAWHFRSASHPVPVAGGRLHGGPQCQPGWGRGGFCSGLCGLKDRRMLAALLPGAAYRCARRKTPLSSASLPTLSMRPACRAAWKASLSSLFETPSFAARSGRVEFPLAELLRSRDDPVGRDLVFHHLTPVRVPEVLIASKVASAVHHAATRSSPLGGVWCVSGPGLSGLFPSARGCKV
jgi:hypothetical protein